MSDKYLLVVARALDPDQSGAALQMLADFDWPGTTKYVVTTGKLDAQKIAKTINIEAGYPAEPAHLQTLAAWAECPKHEDPRFSDALAIFCLRAVLAKEEGFQYLLLLGSSLAAKERLPDLLSNLADRLFLTIPSDEGPDTLLLNLADPLAPEFLDLAHQLYSSGAVYALPTYSLDEALLTAHQSLRLAADVDNPSSSSITG